MGTNAQSKIAVIYDSRYVDYTILAQVKQQLSQISLPIVSAASQIQRELTPQKRRLFPTLMVTERPDRTIYNLGQGKIVILLNGTPFVVILPAVFFDFFAAMDDLYMNFWVSKFLIVLRYVGLFMTIMLAPLYVGITSYNPEFFRIQLALSIAGSRAPVPYPSYTEVLFMLLMMELLSEASLRLPKMIGSTATTVGGLILGQAATQAGLVIANCIMHWHVAHELTSSVLPERMRSRHELRIKGIIVGIFAIVTLSFAGFVKEVDIQQIGVFWLNIRFGSEILMVAVLLYFVKRSRA